MPPTHVRQTLRGRNPFPILPTLELKNSPTGLDLAKIALLRPEHVTSAASGVRHMEEYVPPNQVNE